MITFPKNPDSGDQYAFGDRVWTFNGSAWDLPAIISSVENGLTLNSFTLGICGPINFHFDEITRPKFKDYAETLNAIGTITSNTAISFATGNVQTVTGNGDCEFSFTGEPTSGSAGTITLLITNGGANTTTWEAAVKWPGNVAPSLTSSGIDILSFITVDGGTTIYGFVGGINFS
jgi:hypothetical protein